MSQTFTAPQVKKMLAQSMDSFTSQMILLIRETAKHPKYMAMTSHDALVAVADKLETMKENNK